MPREIRLLARLLTTTSVLALTVVPCFGQLGRIPGSNQVVSCEDNQTAGTLVLHTEKKTPLPAPQIQFLPGSNGATVLIADFDGLVWSRSTHVSRSQFYGVSGIKGIQEVRAGQFQSMPPVCRISLSSTDPSIFQSVSFKALPGKLVVTWPSGNRGTAQDTTPATAPPAVTAGRAPQSTSSEEEFSLARSVKKKLKTLSNYLSSDPPAQQPESAEPPLAPSLKTAKPTAELATAKSSANSNARPGSITQPAIANARTAPNITQPAINKAQPAAAKAQTVEVKHEAITKPASVAKAQPGQIPLPAPDYLDKSTNEDNSTHKPIAPAPYAPAPPNAVARFLGLSKWKSILTTDEAEAVSGDRSSTGRASGKRAASSNAGNPRDDRITYEARSDADAGSAAGTTSNTSADSEQNIPKLEVASGPASARIRLTSEAALKFKSFRLHDPERYVIDFEQLGALASAQVPDVQDPTLLQSLRVGSPDGLSGRLVLDLPSPAVNVSENNVNANEVAFVLTTGDSQQVVRTRDGLRNVTIVLDAGHGGSDPGAQRAGVSEKEVTLAITNRLKKALERAGARVLMTRTDDTFVSLEDRVKITNSTSPDVFLSVHINALESTSDIHGIETYYQTDQSRPLAESIHQMLVSLLEAPDRSVRKARFYVINHTPVPAILAEVGFISNSDERQKLISSDYQTKIADALTQGVILYLSRKDDIAQTPASTAKGASAPPAPADGRPLQRLAETTSGAGRPLK